jgi:4'-phosphopantetheinyl transferase
VIAPGEVHVWRIELARVDLLPILDKSERARAAAFRFEEHRRRFIAAHVALRRTLAPYLASDPAALRFSIADYGKPYLAGASLRFSLSHSAGLALIAVALDTDLGVDVEHIRPNPDVVALARRFFPPDEAAAVAADPPSFYRYWTRREAFLKALGLGLRGLSLPIPPGYCLTDLNAPPTYAAALAVSASGYAIIQFP